MAFTGFVTLNTWGTHYQAGSGAAQFFDSGFFGANCGHASMGVTFPADQAGRDLVSQYCFNQKKSKQIIPFHKHVMDVWDNGKVTKQEVYTVYFSWWDPRYGLVKTINEDNMLERPGASDHVLDPRFAQGDNPLVLQERTFGGALGSRKMKLSPQQIIHNEEKLTTEQRKLFEYERKLHSLEQEGKKLSKFKKNIFSTKNKIGGDVKYYLIKNKIVSGKLTFKNILNHKKEIDDNIARDKKENERKIKETKKEIAALKETLSTPYDLMKLHPLKTRSVEELKEFLAKPCPKGVKKSAWGEYKLKEIDKCMKEITAIGKCLMRGVDKSALVLFDNADSNEKDLIKSWRKYFVENITKEEFDGEKKHSMQGKIAKLYEVMKEWEAEHKHDIILDAEELDFFKENYSKFVSMGHPPDNQVTLPVGTENGLNVERMLKKMSEIGADQGESFDMLAKNCSVTVGAVLKEGAREDLKEYFDQKMISGFGTPQAVLNGAIEYEHTIRARGGKKGFFKKMADYNPLNPILLMTGRALNKACSGVLEKDSSMFKRTAFGLAVLPLGMIMIGSELVKGIFTPQKTFKDSINVIRYAAKNNSLFLKITTIPLAFSVAIVMAVPAALQFVVEKGIINPIKHIMHRKAEPEQGERIDLGKNIQEEEIIHPKNPKDAIFKMEDYLLRNEGTNKVPLLPKGWENKVMGYIASLDRGDPTIARYEKIVSEINRRITHNRKEPDRKEPEKTGSSGPSNSKSTKRKAYLSTHRSKSTDRELSKASNVVRKREFISA